MLVPNGTRLTCLKKEDEEMKEFDAKNFSIALEDIYPSDRFILKDVYPIFDYDKNGNKTDTVVGYSYKLGDPVACENFCVKVMGTEPAVTKEHIEDRVWVTLEGAVIKPYEMKYGKAKCTIIASAIKVLKE